MLLGLLFMSNLFNSDCTDAEKSFRGYLAHESKSEITIDGKLDDLSWRKAPWSDCFVDIEGSLQPDPKYKTRLKMLWDENYFYIAALMEDPHIWAVSTERDSYIWQNEGDFEVFIDPDSNSLDYIEIEINAMGTEWDLLMDKPYSEGGVNDDSWDIPGLKSAVTIDGTLNNPEDIDKKWIVEIAIPWKGINQTANVSMPPKNNDSWRINFSRVWGDHEVIDGRYVKIGEAFEGLESNWVWSAQGVINMHDPSLWGFVTFKKFEKSQNRILDFLSR